MATPISVNIENYTEKSLALFSQPPDFFKPYAQYLKQIGGKFNYNLRGRPGWIFSKNREQDLRSVVQQITTGQLPSLPVRQTPFTQQGITGILQPSSVIVTPAIKPAESPSTPTTVLPSLVPSGYQQVIILVPRPEVGKSLTLEVAGQKFPVEVESVEESPGIINAGVIRLSDGQRTRIKLENGVWKIPGFAQQHSISV